MPESRLLTKTEFIRGLDCVRRAWLDRNRPDLKPILSLAVRERIEVRKRLGNLARGRYPGGVFATNPGADAESASTTTAALLESRAACLFEATFMSGGRLAQLDVLSRHDGGGWVVDEVKSSSIKEANNSDEEPQGRGSLRK